jgi:hypothetical protein
LKTKPFENVKGQIGCCGIWCGSCVVGNGLLRELTKRYEETIKGYGLKKWAPQDFDFKEFEKGLSSIQNIALCPGCLKGGGKENCEIRACATEKNIAECIECRRPADCKNLELLNKMRTGSRQAGLMVKTEKVGREKFIEKWIDDIKNKFPYFILFLKD